MTYTTNQLPGATNYNWFYPSGWTYVDGQNTYMLTLIANGSTGYYQVGVRVDNTCGSGGSYAIANTFLNGCGYFRFLVSPNPATSTVTAIAKSINGSSQTITKINIYDLLGMLKKQVVFNKVKTANVNVSNLTAGSYIIEIVDGAFKEKQHLQILK